MRTSVIEMMWVVVAALATSATPAAAQCTAAWLPGEGVTGVNGLVCATLVWDADGVGPHPSELVAAGAFTAAGSVAASCIARWNGSTWAPLGKGMNDTVLALAALPNGDLVAAGLFTTAGGVAASRIARWDGSSWAPLATAISGFDPYVFALAVLPNGDLIAGGEFTSVDGVANTCAIARWNGSTWATLGTGISGAVLVPAVYALAVLPSGDLVASWLFTTAGGVSANNIARWDGSNWSSLGTGVDALVMALAILPNGDLIARGNFTHAGGAGPNSRFVARWDGASWTSLGTGVNALLKALVVLPNGDLVAGGNFTTAGGATANRIARWGCPLPPPCYANCDGSTGTPRLTGNDFQ